MSNNQNPDKNQNLIDRTNEYNNQYHYKLNKIDSFINKLEKDNITSSFLNNKLFIEKIENLVTLLSKGKLINELNQTTEKYSQTISEDDFICLQKRIEKYEKEIELEKEKKEEEMKKSKLLVEKLSFSEKEIISKSQEISIKHKEIIDLNQKINQLTEENSNFIIEINVLKQKLDEALKEDNLIKKNNQSILINKEEGNRISCISSRLTMDNIINSQVLRNSDILSVLLSKNLMTNTFKYLDVEDIANLKLSNSSINYYIDNDTILSGRFYLKIIKRKNDKILELKSDKKECISEEYLTTNEKVEELLNVYFNTNKQPAEHLKNAFSKSVEFIEVSVKSKLDQYKNKFVSPIKPNPNTNPISFFGMFTQPSSSVVMNKDDNVSNNSKISSPKSSTKSLIKNNDNTSASGNIKSFESFDNMYLNTKQDSVILNFNYTPFELSKILKDYMKRDMSNNEIGQFFNQLIQWFSELLYNSKNTFSDIKDLLILKDILNIRYKTYKKRVSNLESQIENLKVTIKEYAIYRDKLNEYKEKNSCYEERIRLLEMDILKLTSENSKNYSMVHIYKGKWFDVENDYNEFKNLYRNELRRLRFKVIEYEKEISYYGRIFNGIKEIYNNNNY